MAFTIASWELAVVQDGGLGGLDLFFDTEPNRMDQSNIKPGRVCDFPPADLN